MTDKFSREQIKLFVGDKEIMLIEQDLNNTAVYIIDLNYYIHSGHYAVNLTSRGRAIGGTYSTVKNLLKLAKTAKIIVAALDSDYSFKKERISSYKAHRLPQPEIAYQREAVITFLNAMNIPICRKYGYEADDLIATLTTHYSSWHRPSVIVGVDKDLCALVNDYCFLLNIQTASVMNPKAVFDKYGTTPDKFEDYLALVGDAADGFKGVPGIGPRKAVELLRLFGNVNNIVNNIPRMSKNVRTLFEKPDSLLSLKESILLAKLDRNVPELEKFHEPARHQIEVDKYNELCVYHGFKSLLITKNV